MLKKCAICGAEFNAPQTGRKTCSDGCATTLRKVSHTGLSIKWGNAARQRLKDKGETLNLKLGTPAAMKSPKSGSFETNINAKKWSLLSPGGQIYKVKNLSLFCKMHAPSFGLKPILMYSGLRQVKRYHQGKAKRVVTSYKGWQLIDFEK